MRAPLPAGKDSAKSGSTRGRVNRVETTNKFARIDIFIENLPFHSPNPARKVVCIQGGCACAESDNVIQQISQDAVDLFVSVYPLPVHDERQESILQELSAFFQGSVKMDNYITGQRLSSFHVTPCDLTRSVLPHQPSLIRLALRKSAVHVLNCLPCEQWFGG